MRGNISTILCKDLSIRTKNKSYMESKSEAKDILLEYLEKMMPIMEEEGRGYGWPYMVQSDFYEPFITETLTTEKLDKLNKIDNYIILVVGDSIENYWILAPYKNGFAWVNKSKIQRIGKIWGRDEGLEMWRKKANKIMSNYVKRTSFEVRTLREILYEGLRPSGKTFYLLTPSVSSPSRTLNFSRSGFL